MLDVSPGAPQINPTLSRDRRGITDALVFVFLLLAITAVYASVLLLPYGFSDDYYHLYSYLNTRGASHLAISLGRPLFALIEIIAYTGSKYICQLAAVRAFGLLGLAITSWLFYLILTLVGWRRSFSGLLAFLISCLPASQVYAAWASACPAPWAAALSAAAVLVVLDGMRRGHQPGLFRSLIAVVLLTAAITTYQPSAMFFWVAVAAVLFRPSPLTPTSLGGNKQTTADYIQNAGIFFGIGIVSLAIGFAVFRYSVTLYPELVVPSRTGMTQDPWAKLMWFLQCPLVDALNMLNIHPTVASAVVVASFTVSGMALYFSGGPGRRITMTILALSLIPLSFAPSLIAKESFGHYRIVFAMSALLLFYLFLAAYGWLRMTQRVLSRRVFRFALPLMVALAMYCGATAAWTVTRYFSWPQSVELTPLRYKLSDPRVIAAKRIILLTPSHDESPAGFGAGRSQERDEFGLPSLYQPWSYAPTVYLVRHDIDTSLPRIPVESMPQFAGEWTGVLSPGTVVVDMRSLSRMHWNAR